jgi:hypothetical protein
MKKHYEKPTVTKREKLELVTAEVAVSSPFEQGLG